VMRARPEQPSGRILGRQDRSWQRREFDVAGFAGQERQIERTAAGRIAAGAAAGRNVETSDGPPRVGLLLRRKKGRASSRSHTILC
jgi:hypothetical protein